MISKFAFTATGLLVALCLVSPTFAAPVVIDRFSTSFDAFDNLTNDDNGTSGILEGSISDAPNILFGGRDYSLSTLMANNPRIDSESSTAELADDLDGQTRFSDADNESIESLTLVYDGADADATVNDVTTQLLLSLDPSLDEFVLDVNEMTAGTIFFRISVHDTALREMTTTESLSGSGVYRFPVADFTQAIGVGFDWENLYWIQLDFTTFSLDDETAFPGLALDYFGVESVPEPSSFALLSLGALGLCARRLRRRKGIADTAA